MNPRGIFKPSYIHATVAVSICAFLAYLVLRSASYPEGAKGTLACIIEALSIGGAISLAYFSSFHRSIFLRSHNPFSSNLIGEITIVHAILTFAYATQGHVLPAFVYPVASSLLQSMVTYYFCENALKGLNIQNHLSRKWPLFASLMGLGLAFLVSPLIGFYSAETIYIASSIIQIGICFGGLLGILGWYSLSANYQLDPSSKLNSVRLRLAGSAQKTSPFISSVIISLLQIVLIVFMARYFSTEYKNYNLIFALICSFMYLPTFIDLWFTLERFSDSQTELFAISRLTSDSAKTIVSRHKQTDDLWATTIGVKTSSFTVDHDPDNFISARFPASLLQIRNEEIFNFINQITSHQQLYAKTISQKAIGTINPEHSIRPCIDVLNLFAALYLDAGNILEKRLTCLMSVLPLVNPGLANAINYKEIMPLLKRSDWFFHLNYSWIDQSIFFSPQAARFSVHQDLLGEDAKLTLLGEMKKSYGMGSFIWIGKDAYERILQEAPNLINIMEHHNIQTASGVDLQVFSVKFEHLIPRLQRYYSLDSVREKISDFEPRSEAKKLLSIMEAQIRSHQGERDIIRIIESIRSYNWKGFKEKDHALKLLINMNHSISPLETSDNRLSNAIKEGIATIGYPSQLINQAQLYKLAQRDISKLQKNTIDPNHELFEESWVILANLDFRRYQESELLLFYDIIASGVKNNKVIRRQHIQARMIDCAISLIKTQPTSDNGIKLLMTIVSGMINCHSNSESLTLAIDAFTFASKLRQAKIDIPPRILSHFDAIQNKPQGERDAWTNSLISRWQEYKSVFGSAPSVTTKAS